MSNSSSCVSRGARAATNKRFLLPASQEQSRYLLLYVDLRESLQFGCVVRNG